MATIVLWTVAFGLRQLIRDRQTHLHEEQRWQLLAQQTNDILWDWDLRTNAHWWSNNAIATLGYDPIQEPSIEAWHSRLHPDDRTRIQTSIQSAIDSGHTRARTRPPRAPSACCSQKNSACPRRCASTGTSATST